MAVGILQEELYKGLLWSLWPVGLFILFFPVWIGMGITQPSDFGWPTIMIVPGIVIDAVLLFTLVLFILPLLVNFAAALYGMMLPVTEAAMASLVHGIMLLGISSITVLWVAGLIQPTPSDGISSLILSYHIFWMIPAILLLMIFWTWLTAKIGLWDFRRIRRRVW